MIRLACILSILTLVITSYRPSQRMTGNKNILPSLFAPNIISSPDDEFGCSFTPDGKSCYFSMKSPSTISNSVLVICVSSFKDGHWTEPEVAPFSGHYKDFNPSISPDGSKLFFVSNRPVDGKKRPDLDIWVVEKTDNGWGEPKNIGAPVNSSGYELGCSAAKSGTLYFSSSGTNGNLDIYRSKFINGKYEAPELLSDSVNTANSETDPFIAPDESYILFTSRGRSDAMTGPGADSSYPRSDLYISFQKNGKWTKAHNLGPVVNSIAEESNPSVSPDGKTIYFSSERNFISIPMNKQITYDFLEEHLHAPGNGLGDIYQAPVESVIRPGK